MASKPNAEPPKAPDDSSGETTMSVEGLRRYLAEKLHFSDATSSKKVKAKVLEEVSLDGVVHMIKNHKCNNIITMSGAGISTSAGIPDFRSPGSGLYDNLQKYKLPHPQAVFELDFFEENPRPFFALAKELYPGSFKPTPCHYFIKLLEQKGLLLRHYTQNIDTLERVAGILDTKLVEAHGTFYTGHCMGCRKIYTLEWMKERIFASKIPICEKCPGVVKPDIVFFGENLPDKFHECVETDFKKCDLLIVMGSSLVVQPFASLVDRVSDSCPRLLINREKVGQSGGIMALLGMGDGFEFDHPDNTRDIAWLGDCDEGCQLLADKLGWGDDLKTLIEQEHKRIDAQKDAELQTKEKKEEKLGNSSGKTVVESSTMNKVIECSTKKQNEVEKKKKLGNLPGKVEPTSSVEEAAPKSS